MPILLAHGALGGLDEIFFIGLAIVFSVFLYRGWRASRNFEPELEEAQTQDEGETNSG